MLNACVERVKLCRSNRAMGLHCTLAKQVQVDTEGLINQVGSGEEGKRKGEDEVQGWREKGGEEEKRYEGGGEEGKREGEGRRGNVTWLMFTRLPHTLRSHVWYLTLIPQCVNTTSQCVRCPLMTPQVTT